MQKSVWGPITWKLLHTMVIQINDNINIVQLNELKHIILRILHNLPCPYCTSHALAYIQTSNYKNISTISDLRMFVFQFHNENTLQPFCQTRRQRGGQGPFLTNQCLVQLRHVGYDLLGLRHRVRCDQQ